MKTFTTIAISLLFIGIQQRAWAVPAWAEAAGAESEAVRMETRTSFGGRIVRGTMALSKLNANGKAGTVCVNGQGIEADAWNSASLEDGWAEATLEVEGEEAQKVPLAILNEEGIAIRGGRLAANETWDAGKLQLVQNRVIIPGGITLNISAGTIVKFCEGAGILVEAGGTLNVTGSAEAPVQFAAATNDSVGGDTDKQEATGNRDAYSLVFNGTANLNEYVRILDRSSAPGWYALSITDTVVMESSGEVLVRVTLSGSRGKPVSVKWRTVDGTATYGEDFSANGGVLSWDASSSGMQYIRIPLVKDDVTEGEENFIVELCEEQGAVVSVSRANVRITDQGLHEEWAAGATAEKDAYLDTRRDFGGMLAHGVTAIAVRGDENTDTVPSVDGEELSSPSAFDTTALSDGWYGAELPEEGGTKEASIAVLNDANVIIHGGRLTANESWDAGIIHLVRNNVVIPSGVKLSITGGAVVKFCSLTNIIVEAGGTLGIAGTEDALVTLAHACNDDIGGDTDMQTAETIPQNSWHVTNNSNGTITSNQYVRVLDSTAFPGWYSFSLTDCVVAESDGQARVRLNLSGSRSLPVSVGWRAIADTATEHDDYTLASGIISYSSSESGLKYITIPLVKDELPEGSEHFKVVLLDPCGALIGTGSCTVTIVDAPLEAVTARCTASDVYVDNRSTLGGQLARGTTYVSQVDADEAGTVQLTAEDGAETLLSGTQWDTATAEDGWYQAELGEAEKQLLVLNNPLIVVHGGRLTANETWNKDKTHLVRNWVVIPSGKTLEITAGTVVKCCPGAGIVVEAGGVLKADGTTEENVVFTHAGDETVGESAALNGAMPAVNEYNLSLATNSTFSVNECVQIRWRSSVTGWNVVSITDCVASELDGMARVRVSLSASRGLPVTMQWRAIAGSAKLNDDYTLASGSVTWGEKESGLKYIEIPLVSDGTGEGAENFTVEMLGATAAVLASQTTAKVTIYDQDLEDCIGTACNSADIYLDTRRDFGGMMAQKTVSISKTGNFNEISVPMYGEEPLEHPEAVDTTTWENGWYDLSLDELGDVREASIAVFNNDEVFIHGGRMKANETWDDSKVHLVRNNVVVPNGVTLTIGEGAVVKFCTGASLYTEKGGSIQVLGTEEKHVSLMHVANDYIGGDIDMAETTPPVNSYNLVNNGSFTANEFVHIYDRTSWSDWKTIALSDCVVSEYDEMARVRCTLSASRAYPVTVQWRAIDGTAKYGEDYTLASGTLTWAANASGMQYIEIPLVHDEVEQGVKVFQIQLYEATSALVTNATATVTVYDVAPKQNAGHVEVDTAETWELDNRPHDFWRYLVDGTQAVRYSTRWTENAGGECTVRLSYQGDEGVKTAFVEYTEGEGEATWDATDLPEDGYTLYHETYDADGKLLDTQTAHFHVLQETQIHTGSIQKEEVWTKDTLHLVKGAVTVSGGYHLTIEPGTIVKFIDGSKIWVLDGGELTADGVVFTHLNDDSIGGDTNQDGDETIPLYDGYSIDFAESDKIIEQCECRYITFQIPTSITTDTTLYGDRIYRVTSSTTVSFWITLTIEPGTIIKFDPGTSMTVTSGAKIVSNGTLDKPIVFTSIRDDAYGGDTNRDEDATSPSAGNWGGLNLNNGQNEFSYTYFRYGGSQGTGLLIQNSPTIPKIANCRFEYSSSAGVYSASGGGFTCENCLFKGCTSGVYSIANTTTNTLRNCVIDGCFRGVGATNKCRISLYNSIISDCHGSSTSTGWSLEMQNNAVGELHYCNLWNTAPTSGYINTPSKSVQEQVTYFDPMFRDAENDNYTLKPGSPMIDAGHFEHAPATDFNGEARVNDGKVADTGVTSDDGICPDLGLYEMTGNATESEIDLVVNWVRGPYTAFYGDEITVTWQTVNVGSAAAKAPWTDVISLVSADDALGAQSVELGEFVEETTLRQNGFKQYSATFTVPAVSEGVWCVQVAANQYRDVREGKNEENNFTLCSHTLQISAHALSAGDNEVNVPGGETASYRVAHLPSTGGLLLFHSDATRLSIGANAGYVSSNGKTQWSAVKLSDGVWAMNIPANQTSDVYVQIENQNKDEAVVEVEYDDSSFAIYAGDVRRLPNRGTVTLPLVGTRLASDMEVWLQCGSRKISALRMLQDGDGVFWTTFDIESVMAGDYDVCAKLKDSGETCSASALEIYTGGMGAQWWCTLTGPATARSSRTSTLTFTYGNSGDMEMPAPYVRFYNEYGARLKFAPDEDWQEEREFLAISGSYPYSVLKPGETRSINVYFTIADNSATEASLAYTYTIDDDSAYPWAKNAAAMRPDWASDEAWGYILASLKSSIGLTWNDYLDTMRSNLDQLGAMGYLNCRLDQLWQMEVNSALGVDGGISTIASATDLARDCRGMSIAFARSYSGQLSKRMCDGVLGRGWTHSYDYTCKLNLDEATFEISYPGGSIRTFSRTGSKWYARQASDRGTMALSGKLVTITERSGSYVIYDTELQRPVTAGDLDGNTVSLEWTDGLLRSVTHSDGQWLKLDYEGGLLSAVSDDQGRNVTYAYSDGNLVEVTSYDGLKTTYGYMPYTHTPSSRALIQTSYPDGTTRDFVYDKWGRVATMSVNGTEQTVEVYKEGMGIFTTVDADGAESTVYSGPYGEVLQAIDPFGNSTKMNYDQDTHQLLSILTPMGKKVSMEYDADQNVNKTINPAGFATEFTHTPAFGSMDSFTDANGQRVTYSFDAKNRQIGITYQDDSQESWSYDEKGDVRTWTNRRGQMVTSTYGAEGRIVEQKWPDGRTFSYEYDAKGNTTRISDTESGDILMEYDEHEWMTKITYPKNRWFAFQRDGIGRVTRRTAFDGHVLNIAYDSLGRAWRLTDGEGKLYKENLYDDTLGRLVRENNGNGTYTTYEYDLLGRVTDILHHGSDDKVFSEFHYAHNADGNRVSMATSAGTHNYLYDAAGQLTQVTYPDRQVENFSYDPVGNRLKANDVAYTKNALNQYLKAGTDSFTYDADGNMTSWTTSEGTATYDYDVLNRLVRVVKADGTEWSCRYDAMGNRISVTDNGVTRESVYLGGIYADFENGSETRYLGGIVESDDGIRYWHCDGLASVRAITDGKGALVGTQDYGVFGDVLAFSGETTDFGFVGMGDVRQDSTGLLFMQNRYYSIELGRFIQSDPIGINAGDVNFYRYCGNDGVNFIDLNGLSDCSINGTNSGSNNPNPNPFGKSNSNSGGGNSNGGGGGSPKTKNNKGPSIFGEDGFGPTRDDDGPGWNASVPAYAEVLIGAGLVVAGTVVISGSVVVAVTTAGTTVVIVTPVAAVGATGVAAGCAGISHGMSRIAR